METVVKTIYSTHIQTIKLLNKSLTVLPNSTLNQKFNLFANEVPSINETPVLGYVGIGNKGASYEVTSTGHILTTPIPHLARHASLYNFIPFVIREVNNDISSTERTRYRMRVPMTINSVDYVAYYLRAFNLTNVVPEVEIRNVNNEIITTAFFTPSLSDLSPTPPVISNNNLNNPNGDYLVSTAKIDFVLSQNDVQEILQACDIIFGDPRYAVINEIALCTGIDRVLRGTFGTTVGNYTEVVVAQVATFISQYHALTSNTTEVNIKLDVGGVEPLLV